MAKTNNDLIIFEDGCMWEGFGWQIAIDLECSDSGGGKPCKHCHGEKEVIHARSDGGQYTETVWICPKVVIAYNEGGFGSTGLCLDCIIEAVETMQSNKERID